MFDQFTVVTDPVGDSVALSAIFAVLPLLTLFVLLGVLKVKAWLARNPRITLHFTPTSASWMNMVEIFFGIITRQAIRRGTFANVGDLITAIRRFIDAYNDRCEPFTWTRTADQIFTKAIRPKTSDTDTSAAFLDLTSRSAQTFRVAIPTKSDA